MIDVERWVLAEAWIVNGLPSAEWHDAADAAIEAVAEREQQIAEARARVRAAPKQKGLFE